MDKVLIATVIKCLLVILFFKGKKTQMEADK